MVKTLLFAFLSLGLFLGLKPSKPTQPNIVLIFMDDLGYGDLSCYGATQYTTPNLDKMANEGLRFTNFLAAQAVCSASRAALLTGCYPNRIGIWGALMPNAKIGLNANEVTIAEMLKDKGYKTGIFGKWHLGHQKEFLPLQHGFDEYFGLPYSNDMWPVDYDGKPATDYRKTAYPILPLISQNDKVGEVLNLDDQAKLTATYTEKAVAFINKNKKEPFFLYLPHSMPHVPIAASAKFKGKSKQGAFGDTMMEIDWSVGEIMKALKTNGLDDNTLVIFTSDNGPWLNFGNHAGSAGGLREGKGTSYEGGQRVPCIVRWKGHTPAGIVCNQLSSAIDILPTLAKITGAALPDHKIDGVDILTLIEGKIEQQPRKYFYYYYERNSLEAVRRDDWKLVLPHRGRTYEGVPAGNDGFPGKLPTTDYPLALFDLRRDPGERYNVKDQYPQILAELQLVAEEARNDLGDAIVERIGKNQRLSGKVE